MSWAGIPEAAPMGPFLRRSMSVHAVVLAAAVLAAGRSSPPPQQVYRIDFIGASAAILNRSEAGTAPAAPAPAAPAAKPEARRDPDSFNLKPTFRPLPKPSFLDAARADLLKKAPAQPSLVAAPSAPAAAASGSGGGEGAGTASVSADMPDFPYPWYLTSLRQNLWTRWSENMPPGPAECMVTFSILRDGSIVDVRVSQTSGDRGFDYAAMSAARASGPLPPLPPLFKERFLTVHVQFKAN